MMRANWPQKAPWRSLAIFYVVAFAISCGLWAPLVAARQSGSASPPTWLHLAGSLGPSLAALIAAELIQGRSTVTTLLVALSPRRLGPFGWLTVAGITAAINLRRQGSIAARDEESRRG
jgi:hypothetical protein